MSNWVVSAHGGKDKKKSKLRQFLAPTEKFKYGVTMVPIGMELVMFTQQAAIFYGGDDELDELIQGNENGAIITSRTHKVKTGGYITPDYNAYGTTDFRSGIYIVGSGGAGTKAIDLPDGTIMKLSAIFEAAAGQNVKRIYWLCCTCLNP
ncbi:MAG TPA: hypothetical protein VG456_17755 [Candidatus Sulfopaludibacter sp.]|jgi:hypothetical protein|nr:hypothetical protein [Candidatus Sulfopaludibacter sp.]